MKKHLFIWSLVALYGLAVSVGAQVTTTSGALLALSRQALAQLPEDQVLTIPGLLKSWERQMLPPDTMYINLELALERAYAQTNQRTEAIQLLKKVIDQYKSGKSFGKPEDLVKAYYRLSFCQRENGDFVSARTTVEQGIQVGMRIPRCRWLAHLHNTLANILLQSGDYEKAVQAADLGIRYGEQAKDAYGIANGLFEKSKSLSELGRSIETRPYLERAIQLVEKDHKRAYDLSLYFIRLAFVYQDEKKIPQSLLYFRRGIALNRQLNDSLGLGNNNIDLGYFLYEQGQYDQAIAPLLEAIKCHPTPFGKARALDNLGAVYWQQKKFEQALTAYQQGFNLMLARFTDKSVTALPNGQTVQLSSHKEYLFTLIQDKADTWLDWAKATGQRRYFQHALETYQLADQMIDFMRWEHTGTGSKLYWRQKTRGLYERAIETCYRLNDTEQGYRFFEKSRAVMLTDKLNELGAHHQLTPAQVAQENGFRQRLTEGQNQLAASKPDTKAYDEVRLKLSAEQEQFDGFIRQLEQSNPAYYRYKYDNTIQSLADVRRWLGKQSASLVSYFVGDSALYVLSATASGAQLRRQSVATYKPTVHEYIRLLADHSALNRQFSRYLSASNALYRQVLAPLQLPAGRVVVSPDGFFVPFESLSRSATQPDYLMQQYAFSYTYSVKVLLKEQEVHTAGGTFLGMAPVAYAPKLEQATLTGSDAALNRIGESFRSPMLLTRQAATRHAFQQQAANYQVIQLFTHADADSANREPVLYFADSTLQLSDLTNGALPQTQLLVLSACKTGIGVNQRGEGVFSLARGFAALGVPSVLTTLWSVNSEPTYALTEAFYRYLADGLPKDVALQRAKQDYWQTADRNGQLPDQWAGLILVGNAGPLQTPERWPYAAGAGLVVAGIGWMVWRKQYKIGKYEEVKSLY